MASGGLAIPEHPDITRNHGYQYGFHPKHHLPGRPASRAAQWSGAISRDQEFAIFDEADFHDLLDEDGNLFGLLREGGEIAFLGTLDQQIAFFPLARPNEIWHGYPLANISRQATNPRPPIRVIPTSVLSTMVDKKQLDSTDMGRLLRGKPA